MKQPKRIYTSMQDTHYVGHMGMWSNTCGVDSTEYIRRDVVIEAMERMKTVMPCDIVDLNAILDKVIDKTNND